MLKVLKHLQQPLASLRFIPMSKTKTELMHEAALRVLANYQSAGEPFALFLSSWDVDDRQREVLDFLKELDLVREVPERIEGRIGLERQVRILLQREHLETGPFIVRVMQNGSRSLRNGHRLR